jgi:class 3 adenylate cyclase/predicted ATPase
LDIVGWLRGIGLAQYAEIFSANDIDGELLGQLTNDDLKDIGIASFGHRKKLLEAIAALAAMPNAASPIPVAEAKPETPDCAQRRHLVVLFCDLVGSTIISASLDAEDWRSLVSAYLDAASEAVTQVGGVVAKKLGDGIMALFGHPIAQENDSERAVRAALAIQRALAELNREGQASGAPELVARIGIAAGAVVVDSAGEIFGDGPNIAARVQALAEPGTVLVTASVQRQVAGLFVADDRGAHALRGAPEPTTLYRIVRASGGGRRSGQRALTPLIGRDEEMAILLRRWERARQGEGQLVQIVGEPGLGKSRLVEEFHNRLADTPHTWVEWSSSQLLQNTPMHPIADWGRQRFGGADVPAARRLADLESSLSQVKLDPTEYVPLLAPLLDVPLPPERAAAVTPEELRRRQLAAVLAWLMAGARTQPIVLAFEDLHWVDPTTLDVLRGLAERGALAPLFVVATTRPEFRAPWGVRSHHSTITLAPLDRAQVRQMVGELAARHALSNDVIEGVSERTGGVPLFIEEVTRLLLERGEQGGAQAIPPTLQQSLTARLDRLGPGREVAMIGAVIGRGFSFSLLRAVAGADDSRLQQALERLAEADILLVEGVPPEAEYRFKHVLIQDAAYENLLKSRRQALHRRAAETLRDQFADRAASQPEMLAHHFTQAGLTDSAIEYWGKAGDQALRRSAFQEAISHLGKAIQMADKAGEPGSTGRRLKLQSSYGLALTWSRGSVAGETRAATARIKQLAAEAKDPAVRWAVYYGLWVPSVMGGQTGSARLIAETYLAEAKNAAALPDIALASRMLGHALMLQGAFNDARAHLEETLGIYDPVWGIEVKRGQADSRIVATVLLSLVSWQLGEVERARGLIEQAKTLADESRHGLTLAVTYFFASMVEMFRGDAEATLRDAEILIEIAANIEVSFFAGLAKICRGWARARLGDRESGSVELRQGLAELAEQKALLAMPAYQGLLAEFEAERPNPDRALAQIDEALALAQRTGQLWTDALLYRIRGDVLLKADPGNSSPAEDAYLAALAIAREQSTRSFGLRAALSLAKLYQLNGRPVEAHDALTPALEGFSPTPELPEIAEAQALLAVVAETDEVKTAATQRGAANFF